MGKSYWCPLKDCNEKKLCGTSIRENHSKVGGWKTLFHCSGCNRCFWSDDLRIMGVLKPKDKDPNKDYKTTVTKILGRSHFLQREENGRYNKK